jgi:radical SAM superfamily enzyme YgiQ (UPF0313 family)
MSPSPLQPRVILVADRTLSGRYRVLFEGIFATMQTTQVPEALMRHFLTPPVVTDAQGRAHTAALGLRRIESSLLTDAGLTPDDVVCTTPERLPDLLGPWVKLVLFSSSDPLGQGMSNTTTSNFWRGELYTRLWTRQALHQLKAAKQHHPFKVVLGGAGAWQCAAYPDRAGDLGIDVIYEGYFEDAGPELILDLLEDRPIDPHIVAARTGIERVRPICGASMMGIIELSRGCGRGCSFCSMASRGMKHLAPDLILADLETNLSAGVRAVVSGSEDFFRYGGTGTKPNFEALASLLTQMQKLQGLSFMQIDHGNVTSVLQLEDGQLREIRRLLSWKQTTRYLWVNMGVESANGRLVAANSPGKIAPYRPEDWADMVSEAVARMNRTGFFPVISVILGLPGEQPSDVAATLKLVQKLSSQEVVVFPIFYEPILPREILARQRFSREDMRPDHLELYRTCYEINFKRVPKLFYDNQRAGGVPWLKRAALQVMGRAEILNWRTTFRRLAKQLQSPAVPAARDAMRETL